MIQTLERLDLNAARAEWATGSPYLVLRFLSAESSATPSRVAGLLVRYSADTGESPSLAQAILQELQFAGHVYEVAEKRFAVFPPYAIQRAADEWLVLGDTTVDPRIAKGCLFEVRTTVQPVVSMERLAVVSGDGGEATLTQEGVRLFRMTDLLNLVPDVRNLYPPLPWEGFEPSAFGRWEVLNQRADWVAVSTRPDQVGLCRGIALDAEDNILATRYFWRHHSGWSPLTSDEATIWVLKVSAESGATGRAVFNNSILELPVRLPYRAFTALRYLARVVVPYDGGIKAEGLDEDLATEIVGRLALPLERRV